MEPLFVDPEALRSQAVDSRHAAADLTAVRGAIASVNPSGGAFGLMCSFLVPPIALVSETCSRIVEEARGMLERESQALRAFSDDVERVDEEFEQRMRQVDTSYSSDAEYWR